MQRGTSAVADEIDNRIEIELLKKDVTTMSALLTKFDSALDRMQEIATSLSKMVSLQEQRLEVQETATKELQSVLEMRRIEHNQEVKELHSRITTVNKDLTQKIDDTEKNILAEIAKLRDDIKKEDTGIINRVGQIEMWKYGVVLVIIVLVWIAAQADVIDKVLK